MSKRSVISMAMVGLALATAAASAQSGASRPMPVLRGAIQDTLGRPLDGALIEIPALKLRMFTGSNGAYRLDSIRPGKYWVVARRIGYEALQSALTFGMGDDREITFQLAPLPHVLPEEIVKGDDQAWEARYRDFVTRSRGAFGYFLTRDDIDRARPIWLGDVVSRHLPFTSREVYFRPAFSDFDRSITGIRRGSASTRSLRNCSPLVSVNGSTPTGIWAVNDFRPSDVEAVEVYRGNRMLPAIFSSWGTECGLVVVWTRS